MRATSCFICSRFYHHIQTMVIHEDMLCWIQFGTKTVIENTDQRHVYHAGELLLLRRGSQYDIINQPDVNSDYRALILLFSPELTQEFYQRYANTINTNLIDHPQKLNPSLLLQNALKRTFDVLNDTQYSSSLKSHHALEVLLLLAEQGWRFPLGKPWGWYDKVRQLIRAHPEEEWPIDRLAHCLHTSSSTLRRHIATTGTTLGDLVRETRLEIGLMLLQTTSLAIGEVAARCGYESHSRFSSAFKQRFGFLPSNLRAETHLSSLA
jgi:AraC-like DNA-binding protein